MKHSHINMPVILLYNLDRTWPAIDIEEILSMVDCLASGLASAGHEISIVCLENEDLEGALLGFDPNQNIVFNWCEEIPGHPHSAAQVASKMEEMGYTFTGADSLALQFSWDKPGIKERLKQFGIPTPAWQVFETGNVPGWNRFPAIVKPAFEHSSFGITHEAVVHDPVGLSRRITQIIETFQQPALVEDFIDGREFHVTVVGNGRLQVLPIAEMDFSAIMEDSGRLCTYDSKFFPGSLDYQMIRLILPAVLSTRERKDLESVALSAYRAADCRDYARLDIRLRDGLFYVLDVNPNADISPDTSVFLSAQHAGHSFGQFGSLLVGLAAHRLPVRRQRAAAPDLHTRIAVPAVQEN